MKKVAYVLIAFCLMCFVYISIDFFAYAADGDIVQYEIYDESGNLLTFNSEVEVGDTILTKDFYEYQIYKIDGNKCYARVLRKLNLPSHKKPMMRRSQENRKIGLYMTHNDESYRLSDGVDSVYGAGGIHDVARLLQNELKRKGISVILDETLHIPHDSSAYSRSSVTAKSLFDKENPDALFDIHRDGVARKYYYTAHDGKDYSKIRIVVGKSNPNFEENYKFAQEVFAIGNSEYPWLFLDIYCGKGHYNQELMSTNLLFEMGTYLIEKEYVLNSVPLLADTIETALYSSVYDPEDDVITEEEFVEETTHEKENSVEKKNVSGVGGIVFVSLLLGGLLSAAFVLTLKKKIK